MLPKMYFFISCARCLRDPQQLHLRTEYGRFSAAGRQEELKRREVSPYLGNYVMPPCKCPGGQLFVSFA